MTRVNHINQSKQQQLLSTSPWLFIGSPNHAEITRKYEADYVWSDVV